MRGRILGLAPFVAAALLAGCNSTEMLDPSGVTLSSETASTAGSSTIASSPGAQFGAPAANASMAVLTEPARIQLAPIVGSTVEAITPLSRRLSLRAPQRGISFAGEGGAGTTHILKGYFSTISDGGETSVIYVWDVIDPAGNRVHRIQGQEKAADATVAGWAGVPAATMETIADRTIDQFVEWLASRQS